MMFNRDASLIVHDEEVAEYFTNIFEFDWEFLAKQNADESVAGIRVAGPGERTPEGMRRVSMAEFFEIDDIGGYRRGAAA